MNSTETPFNFDHNETPTPVELERTLEACRVNLQALLLYMVGEHGLARESAAKFLGRRTLRVIEDFRRPPGTSGFISCGEQTETDPFPLVTVKMEELTEVDVIVDRRTPTPSQAIKSAPAESAGKEDEAPFDVAAFFSDILEPDSPKNEAPEDGATEKALKKNGDFRVLELRSAKTPLMSKAEVKALVKRTRVDQDDFFLDEDPTRPTPNTYTVVPGSLTEAIHLALANANYTQTPDGAVRSQRPARKFQLTPTEKLDLDFDDF